MHFLKKIEIQRDKYRKEYYSKHPVLYDKITSIEDMNYLNLIDRTFYLIRLREKFYNKHKDVLGIEYADYDTEFKTSNISVNGVKKEYSFEDYIKSLDKTLIDSIAENLKFICEFYGLEPLDHALTKPTPLILRDLNLFTISPFLFSMKDWFRILQNDVSKLYGKPKTKLNNGYLNTEVYSSLKVRFRMFSTEIGKRIGSDEIKHYNVLLPPTVKIETEVLKLMLTDLKFNELIGTETSDIQIKEILVESKKRKLKNLLKFNYNKNKLYTIFFLWLQLKKEDLEQRRKIKKFIDFFHAEIEDIELLEIPDLNFLNDSLYEFLSIMKHLKDYKTNLKGLKKEQSPKNHKTANPDIAKFKVKDLFCLLKFLKLNTQTDEFVNFKDSYYKKTEFPDHLVNRVKHHLHL